ncbi:Protein phosphatase 2C 1, partial [Irineochytrium annulatum]
GLGAITGGAPSNRRPPTNHERYTEPGGHRGYGGGVDNKRTREDDDDGGGVMTDIDGPGAENMHGGDQGDRADIDAMVTRSGGAGEGGGFDSSDEDIPSSRPAAATGVPSRVQTMSPASSGSSSFSSAAPAGGAGGSNLATTLFSAPGSSSTTPTPEAQLRKDSGFAIGFAEDRNRRYRRTMEDAHSYLYNFGGVKGQGFFAIYDGHAGKGAADWCGSHLHENLLKLLNDNPNKHVAEVMNDAFLLTDEQLSQKKTLFSGCTVIVAFVRTEEREQRSGAKVKRRVLYTANVGDARAVLSRGGKAVRLSYDHKGSDAQEAQRIVGAGGFLVNNRVNGVLAVTRALGDIKMKEWVIGAPYTTETVLDETDGTLILACDGLWDVCTDQDAVDLVKETEDPQAASAQLLAHALEKCSTDNLSVLVIRLDADFLGAS